MAIKYDKLFSLLKEKGITPYVLRRDKVVGVATLEKLRGNTVKTKTGEMATDGVGARVINNLCAYLHCQPGDIMEYVPDNAPADGEN